MRAVAGATKWDLGVREYQNAVACNVSSSQTNHAACEKKRFIALAAVAVKS